MIINYYYFRKDRPIRVLQLSQFDNLFEKWAFCGEGPFIIQ